ncbi:MAG: LysM peptidoglycan-binding domain-containing protein [Anaerolineae bacterium]
MSSRIRILLVMLPLAVVMTGCFQQAGPALQQSAGVTTEPLSTQQVVNNPPTLSSGGDTTLATATGGLPFPTVDTGNTLPTNTPGGVAITIISPTRALPATATSASEQPTAEGGIDATPIQFVTPAQPLSPNPTATLPPETPIGTATSTPSGLITPTALSSVESGGQCTHTVQPGENLYRIALKYEVSLDALRQANPQVSGDLIQPGDMLNIPECDSTVESGGSQPPAVPTTVSTPLPGSSQTQTYTVQNGDTLYSIALKFGVTIAEIQAANGMDNPNRLAVGQELVIPGAPQ